jgi:hypothetical protein
MTTLLRVLIAAAAILPCASAIADDPFMAIHMQNQQVGSAVQTYWHSVATAAPPSLDGFMAIHRDNQKITSAVTAYLRSLSDPTIETVAAAVQ